MLRIATTILLIGLASRTAAQGADAALEGDVRALLARAGANRDDVGIVVVAAEGIDLVAIQGEVPLVPASNLKILTTVAALELVGPDHEFSTQIVATSPLRDGTIAGDVVLRGRGDPNISGRFYGDDPTALLRTWAESLRERGLTRIAGDLVADATYFDDERFLPGWDRGQAGRWYCAEISALSLNDNCVDITVTPGRPGEKGRVEMAPRSDFVRIVGAPTTVARGRTRVSIHRSSDATRRARVAELAGPLEIELIVAGTIVAGEGNWTDSVAVQDPASFFANALARALADAGIGIGGKVRKLDPVEAAKDVVAGSPLRRDEVVLVEHRSTLRADLAVINKRSQNLHAEMLLKTLGRLHGGAPSVAGGFRAVAAVLEKRGIPVDGLFMADGSGLSRDSRASARILVRALDLARRAGYFDVFLDSLPVGGRDGTLQDRFRAHPELVGEVFAKTGYIRGVCALSGFLRRNGRIVPFAMIFNDLPGGLAATRRLQEDILARVWRSLP